MEFRVVRSLMILGGVLGMVYRALFRSFTPVSTLQPSYIVPTIESNTKKPNILDSLVQDQSEQPVQVSRVQVVPGDTKNFDASGAISGGASVLVDGLKFHSTQGLFSDPMGLDKEQSRIPGMYIWEGKQKILSLLGQAENTKIIYKDVHNTHFCLLSSFDLAEWKRSIKSNGGNLLAIGSEIDRNKRGLFGDNAFQIILPKYRTTKQIWLIQYRADWWYMQIDTDWYNTGAKDFIKNGLGMYYSI